MKLHSNTYSSRTVHPSRTGRTPDAAPLAPYGGVRCPVRYRPVPSGVQNYHTVRGERTLEYRFHALNRVWGAQSCTTVRCVRCQNHLESKSGNKRALNNEKEPITHAGRIEKGEFRLKGQITPDAPDAITF